MKRESGQTFVSLLQKNMDQKWSVSSLPDWWWVWRFFDAKNQV